MADLWFSSLAEDDYDYVEAEWAVVYFVGGEEVSGGSGESGLFREGNRRFGGGEILACASADLDEDYGAVGVDHNKVDFTCGAGVISGEELETFVSEESLGAFLTPPAEAGRVS